MNEAGKITVSHRRRSAAIYVRQSTLAQVERNKESTARQYDLVARPGAGNLTYRPDQLGTVPELSYVGSTEFHQIGWDLEVQLADGSWVWVYNNIVMPGSYIQFAQDGSGSQHSNNCETFPGVGF
jgi:hypothetical protein